MNKKHYRKYKELHMPFFGDRFLNMVQDDEMNPIKALLYLEMIWFQYKHEVGFKSPKNACKMLKKSLINLRKIDEILTRYYEDISEILTRFQIDSSEISIENLEGFWNELAFLEVLEKRNFSGTQRDSVNSRWEKEKIQKDTMVLPKKYNGNTLTQPNLTQPNNSYPKDKNTKKKIDETRFSEFWDAYDYKVARGKAEDSYLKAIQSVVDETVLIRQAKAYLVSLSDRKYQKHPTTWLNARCWEDEYRQSKPQQPVQPTQEKNYGSIDDL